MQSVHGGNIIATAKRLNCGIAELIDMSSNLSPLPTDTGLLAVLRGRLEEIAYLPESDSESLCESFAARFRLQPSQIAAGNGTTEYIFSIPATTEAKRAIIVNPTYSDYKLATDRAGLFTENFQLHPQDDFHLDLQELARILRGDELVFLCNPNNPTGILTPSTELHDLICRNPATRFLVDETYLPFTRTISLSQLPLPDNLYILQSFSKIYGIPGLRLGFLIAAAGNIAAIHAFQKPWGVNRLAQIAGEYLLLHGESYIKRTVDYIKEQRPRFLAELKRLDHLVTVPSHTHFVLSRLDGDIKADLLQRKLLEQRIMIRNCANFIGLDERYFRLSLKDEESNRQCLEAIRQIFAGSHY
jgi:threonine-phosphate decarboxylase